MSNRLSEARHWAETWAAELRDIGHYDAAVHLMNRLKCLESKTEAAQMSWLARQEQCSEKAGCET